MKLGIMQPYFFPYIGYFSLLKHVDMFVLLDEVQFIRHGWIERNRILKPDMGWQYFKIPLIKHARETKIKDIIIDNQQNWREKMFAQLLHYKKKAAYYYSVVDVLSNIFSQDFTSIVDLNKISLLAVCEYLNIITPIKIFSEMDITIDPVKASDEWALNICKALNANEYWNPRGGVSIFNKEKYDSNNVTLYFHRPNALEYNQNRTNFEPSLSIIDVMMFVSPEEINNMLDNYDLF